MPCVGSAWGRVARRLQGWACGRAWFGSGAGGGQTRIGTRACQTRIGKGPGQIRIGNTGGSNPKRERAAPKKEKTTRGCWFLPAAFYWGFNQGFYWAAKNLGFYPGFYLGLAAPGFYLGKNLGRSPGVGSDEPPRPTRPTVPTLLSQMTLYPSHRYRGHGTKTPMPLEAIASRESSFKPKPLSKILTLGHTWPTVSSRSFLMIQKF